MCHPAWDAAGPHVGGTHIRPLWRGTDYDLRRGSISGPDRCRGEELESGRRRPRSGVVQKRAAQTTFAIGAAILAAQSAGLSDRRVNPRRFGISLGCGETFEDFPRFIHAIDSASTETTPSRPRFAGPALRLFDPDAEREYEPYSAAARLSAMFGAEGPNRNYIAACVSAAQAIGEAGRLIRRGAADVMLAGGSHSTIHPFGVTGFHRLSALSTRNDDPAGAVRPFDRDRDGFVIGEGGRSSCSRISITPDVGRADPGRADRLRVGPRRLPNHRHASGRPRNRRRSAPR